MTAVRDVRAAAAGRPLLTVVRRRISERTTVLVKPDPGLGFVVLHLWHGTGSRHDPADRSGLAHVVEHVLFGSATADGSANATTAFERTDFVTSGPPAALPELVDRAARRLRAVAGGVRAEDLDGHRRVVVAEIQQREEPARFGSGPRRGLRLLFGPDHPFGRPPVGRAADVGRITAADVDRFVAERYGAAELFVAVVGSVEPRYAVDLVRRRLADRPALPLTCASNTPAGLDPVGPAPAGQRREDVEEGQAGAMLRYTFALPAETSAAAAAGEVAMAVLAGAPWSVLGADFAVRHRLTGASAQHLRCGNGPSLGVLKLAATADADLDGLDAAVTGRLAELARRGPAGDVLEAAAARRIKEHLAVLGRARSCAEELCRRAAWPAGGDVHAGEVREGSATAGPVAADDVAESAAGHPAALRRVDAAQVAAVAADCLAARSLVAFHAAGRGGTSWIV